MNRDWFDDQMGRMSVLKAMPADMDGCFQALQDIPTTVLDAGVTHALRTRAWFPTPAELRIDCDVANRQRPRSVPPTSYEVPIEGGFEVHIANPFGGKGLTFMVTEQPRRHCDLCDDTGWGKFFCGDEPSPHMPWLTVRRCGRRHVHGEHDWAAHCPCEASNPVILRRKDAMVQYAQEPGKVA